MRHQPFYLVLFLALMLGSDPADGQGSLGAKPKKARTPDDYQSRTLKEVTAKESDAESRRDKQDRMIVYGDILPSRVRAAYAGRARPLPPIKKEALRQWARLYAGSPEHYTVPYETELLFSEDGVEYWLAVRKQAVAQSEKELKEGEAVDLYLIRLGRAVAADGWESLLLVESFQMPK